MTFDRKARMDKWWAEELARPKYDWEDVEDPEGRIRKGMIVRWKGADVGTPAYNAHLEVLRLSAPTGLYRRPIHPDDSDALHEMAILAGTEHVPCAADHPEAIYCPKRLGLFGRYLASGDPPGSTFAYLWEEVPPHERITK
jgi:hypothetical protein